MASVSCTVWTPLLLALVFSADCTGRGDSPRGLKIYRPGTTGTSVDVESCAGMENLVAQLEKDVQEATYLYNQMDNEASGLKSEVSRLKTQVAACGSTDSGHQSQTQRKMKQLLETFDSDTFMILRTAFLTREVMRLQNKLSRAANSTDASTGKAVKVLQKELGDKNRELSLLKQQLQGGRGVDLSKISQIILLQNQIWDLDQLGGDSTERQNALAAAQAQLDAKIRQLQRKDAVSAMLALISVQGQITRAQQVIRVHIRESRANYAVFQRQWSQKIELLKKKIVELSRDMNNTEITMEILKLQSEVDKAKAMMAKEKEISESTTTHIRVTLEELKKQQLGLQKQLEEADYVQAQLILKILSTMKELREQEADGLEQETSQTANLQTLLQAKEEELDKALAEVKELRRKLQSKGETCYAQTQSEFEQAVATLARAGEAQTALVLGLIRLKDEIVVLEELIARTDNQEKLLDLNNQLEAKQDEMFSMIDSIKKIPDTDTTKILEIVDLNGELWSLQRKPGNDTRIAQIRALQDKLDGLLGGITGKNNMKPTLMVAFLQNQVDYLQGSLSDLQASQSTRMTQLKEDLEAKKAELRRYVEELKERNETNARLVLRVADLHNQLRNLEGERQSDKETSSLSISQLREQLRDAVEAQSRAQAQAEALQLRLQEQKSKCARVQEEVQELQDQLSLQAEACLDPVENYRQAKTGLQEMIANLSAAGNSRAARLFSVMLNRTRENRDGAESSDISDEEYRDMWDLVVVQVGDSEAARLIMRLIKLRNRVRQLGRQVTADADQDAAIVKELARKNAELQQNADKLRELSPADASLILAAVGVYDRLRSAATEQQKDRAAVAELREQLGRMAAQHQRDQAEIERLQERLNATGARCSGVEAQVKGLQDDLEVKLKELQSKSDTVTSLALQVSTLTLQVADLNSQLQQDAPWTKVKELQAIINEKNIELANKTDELRERSAQHQNLLAIIQMQAEIEKLSKTAKLDVDFKRIKGLQDRLKEMINGIEEADDDNTKLLFIILAERDEVEKLKIQGEIQTQEYLKKIKDLEDQVEDFQQQIKDKTQTLVSSNTRVSDLSAQVMELHKDVKTMEDKISDLREENANNVKRLTSQLDLAQKKLKDSEGLLQQADAKNFDSVMEILELKEKLKTAQEDASKSAKRKDDEMEGLIETQQRENRRLEKTNNDLKQLVQELQTCCSDSNNQCEDVQRQMQQCSEDFDRLLQRISAKDQRIEELTQQIQEQANQITKLADANENLQNRLSEKESTAITARFIIMDPDTANPRVGLSAGNTQLYTMAGGQNVPDLPGRFNVVLATLGKTGYSSGRQYWEVNIANRLCYHLGFASGSAQRKGILKFSPEKGYWTIIRTRQGQFRALDKSPVGIQVKTQPMTMGILLDYKKGQVSFYDTGARSHIYSFSGQAFRDKLYPFINFCDEDILDQTPVEILLPGSTDWIQ